MDKELIERIRNDLDSMADSLNSINDALERLRRKTDEDIANLARRALAAEAAARVRPPEARDTVPDPRFPYIAGRQPRRDGDSFGTHPKPTQGGVDGQDEANRSPHRR